MARVGVVGGGLGGLAVAARLAKLGHDVLLCEAGSRLGGCLDVVQVDDFRWDAGPAATLLPAVLRDLFRKTGRPLERELELVPLEVVREHRFVDGSSVALPAGSRGAQLRAVDALGAGLGRAWVEHVDALGDDWERVRRHYLERPYDPATAPAAATALLASRLSLARRLRPLPDPRLRLLAAYPGLGPGEAPRRAPGWLAVLAYVEQRFGRWAPAGGMAGLADALGTRLATRGVEVRLDCPVVDLEVTAGAVTGLRLPDGTHPVEVAVCAVDPYRLPALRSQLTRSRLLAPPALTHLGLTEPPQLAPEIVLHGRADLRGANEDLVLRTTGHAPSGAAAWTVQGPPGADLLGLLAARGIDVRDRVTHRIDVSPDEQLAAWGGSPWGDRWRGPRTALRRPGPGTPIAGVYVAGAHATPGAGIPFVGLSAALVAQAVGPAGQVTP